MTEEKTGIEKAREVADKIKGEMQKAEAANEIQKAEAIAALPNREIIGFEDILDSDILRVSYVRVVQPTSKKIEMANGKDAQAGSFFFNDTKEAVEFLEVCYLKGKMVEVNFPKDGLDEWKKQLKMLCITPDKKIVILTLATTSFGSFGKYKTEMKHKQAGAAYEYKTLLRTHKEENDKGKYYVVDFEIGEKNTPEELDAYAKVYQDYAGVLDTKSIEAPVQVALPSQGIAQVSQAIVANEDASDIPF